MHRLFVYSERKTPLFSHSGKLLPLCHREHPDQLYYSLVWELLSVRSESPAEGGGNRPMHHRHSTLVPLKTSKGSDLCKKHAVLPRTPPTQHINRLPSTTLGERFRCLGFRTSWFRNSLFPVSILNSLNSAHVLVTYHCRYCI